MQRFYQSLVSIAVISIASVATRAHATTDCSGTIAQYYVVLGAGPPQFFVRLSTRRIRKLLRR